MRIVQYIGILITIARFGSTLAAPAPSEDQFFRQTGRPSVSCKYGKFEGRFLVDTGASMTLVHGPRDFFLTPDPAWISTPARLRTMTGIVGVRQFRNVQFSSFGLPQRPTTLMYREIPADSPFQNHVGTLRMNYLQKVTLRLNFQKMKCECVPSVETDGYQIVPVKKVDFGCHYITAAFPVLGDHSLMVDTGCDTFMTLKPDRLQHMQRLGLVVQVDEIEMHSPGGKVRIPLYIGRSVEIGDYVFSNFPILAAEIETLGREFLDSFDTTLDFPGKRILLKPVSKSVPSPWPPDASGLRVEYKDAETLRIRTVTPDSAGSQTDLRVNDEIRMIDGDSPKDLSLRAIRLRLCAANSTVRLLVERGDKHFHVDLPLSRKFEYPPTWPKLNTDVEAFQKSLEAATK